MTYSRAEQTWAFYEPAMHRYLMWTVLTVLAAFTLFQLGVSVGSYRIGSIGLTILAIPFYLGATAFAFYRDRSLTCQLPATAGERFAVMVLFCFVIVPLSMFVVWLAAEGLVTICGYKAATIDEYVYLALSDINETFVYNSIKEMYKYQWIRVISEFLPASVALYIVVATGKQRFMKAVAGVVGTIVVTGLVAGIYAAVKMIRFLVNNPGDVKEVQAVMNVTMDTVTDMAPVAIAVIPVLVVLILFLTYHKLKNFQM